MRGRITVPAKSSHTTPYWSTSATFPQFAKLAEDVVADVVVVGRGVTGLTRGIPAREGGQIVSSRSNAVARPAPIPAIPARI